MSEEKYREFWLNLDSDNRGFSQGKPDDWLLKNTDHVHVIEYSAYQTLAEKCERYEKALRFYADKQNHEIRHIKENIGPDPFVYRDGGCIARQALGEE